MQKKNDEIEIKTMKVGRLETNCYILIKNNKCLIIDPGDEAEKIVDKVGKNKIVAILITHGHFDHVGALKKIVDKYNCEVYKYENLEEKEYLIDQFKFKIIFTPGHSSDSVTYYFEDCNKMFCGDFIFRENIGRCDLPTGNLDIMYESISKIKKYNNIDVLPGHGDFTTIDYEKEHNIYFKTRVY